MPFTRVQGVAACMIRSAGLGGGKWRFQWDNMSRIQEDRRPDSRPAPPKALNFAFVAVLTLMTIAIGDSSRVGYRIVYYGESQDRDRGVFLLQPGSLPQKIANFPLEPAGCPRLSPDHERLLFDHERGDDSHIYVYDLASHSITRLTHAGSNSAPSWSPDGSRIAFASTRDLNSEIYAMDTNGGRVTQLTARKGVFEGYPAWSPDGEKIAFASQPGVSGLYVMNTDGAGRQRLLARLPGQVSAPAWSPDGKQIAFAVRESQDSTQIYVVNERGTRLRNLTEELPKTHYQYPRWSSDSQNVVFSYFKGALIKASLEDGVLEGLTSGEEFTAVCAVWVFA